MLQSRKNLSAQDLKKLQEVNESEQYAAIKQKMMRSVEMLLTYTELLDYMDDKNFSHAEAIKGQVLHYPAFQRILSSIMRSQTIPPGYKEDFASMMFSLAVEYLSGQSQSDQIYEKLIMKPLQELRENLMIISTSKYYQQSKELAQLSKKVNIAVRRMKKGKV